MTTKVTLRNKSHVMSRITGRLALGYGKGIHVKLHMYIGSERSVTWSLSCEATT